MATNNARSNKSRYQQARREGLRKLNRSTRGRKDPATKAATGVSFWNGTFQGWETADANLMMVLHPNGQTLRFIPTYFHVKAAGSWVAGTTIVQVMQFGTMSRAVGIPVGDPTVATQVN